MKNEIRLYGCGCKGTPAAPVVTQTPAPAPAPSNDSAPSVQPSGN